MFCWKCGKEIEDDSKFCPFCGADVREDEAAPPEGARQEAFGAEPAAQAEQPEGVKEDAPEKKKKGKLIAIAAGIAAAVAVAVIVAVFALGGREEKEESAPAAKEQEEQSEPSEDTEADTEEEEEPEEDAEPEEDDSGEDGASYLYADTPEEAFYDYMDFLIDAINSGSYDGAETVMVEGSSLYKAQESLVERLYEKDVYEELLSCDITDTEEISSEKVLVTSDELIEVSYRDGTSENIQQNYTYTCELTSDGWLLSAIK